ncbi:hypothetical protein NGTWS0302_09800 [Mycolicibacterium cyprinidarum]|uniref:Antitoxin n=1 Tax=Mycolicibacterium cyprinidarum TaxID=2860311 RepID=A0ABQ4VDM8_9MYCO|nr:hypothetical protein NGTWS1803_23520 [Mycolicibacterium sp. NGTWS1803]GJF13711.1 hypothetical protein NGTWS1702_14460 [Mycolicibacterium sp. NGTWSNA01]GJF15682.1 hypothetical protein NGTWS0302_09800 [Mycolicibacterium sp. NGTWS0302]
MADVTTIKVTKGLRDRISAAAARRDQTVQSFIEDVMDDHDRHRRLAAVAAAIGGADEETLSAWRGETAAWAALDGGDDGAQ